MKKILHSGPGIVIGIPTLGRPVSLDWALQLKGMNPPTNFNTVFQIVKGQEIGHARNEIAKFALEQDAKYLFFLGDDTIPPAHALRQLIYRMEQDETIGIVGGVYCCKSDPPDPIVYRGNGRGSYWDWKIGEFFEVTGLGLDCNLIRVKLFEKISQPWFKTVDQDNFMEGENKAETWTEDLYFYKKVQEETKYKVMCEASVIADHVDVYSGKVYKLPGDSLPMRQKAITKDKQALVIGKLPFELSELDREQFELTRFGEEDFVDYRGDSAFLPFTDKQFDWTLGVLYNSTDIPKVQEWVRVSKTKVTIGLEHFLAVDKVIGWLKQHGIEAKENGQFIEVDICTIS